MIQGDVMAVISMLVGICLSAWALTMAYGLLFPRKSELAKRVVLSHPGRCIGRGAILFLVFGVIGLAAIRFPGPLVRLFGAVILLSLFSVAALGMAGIALNAGDRLRAMAPDLSDYGAFSRGAALLVVGCVLPIIGWFAFGPVLWLAALGAGSKAALKRVEEHSHSSVTETV